MPLLVYRNTMRALGTATAFQVGCLVVMADGQADTMRGKDKLSHIGITTM